MKYQKLGEHVLQVRGISFKPENIIKTKKDGYVPVIRSNNITEEGFKESDLIYINKAFIRPEQFIKGGDLVLTASSGSKKTIGKNIQFDSNYEGSFGAFCKLVRPKKSIDSKYLYHFFKTRFFRNSIERIVQGANIANLKNEYIDDLKIHLPPLDDQIRIATLLSKVENLISRRREQLKQLDELLKSVFLDMFGDPMSNPKKFPIKLLSEFYINSKHGTKCGPFGSALKKNELLESGIAVWNMDNISSSGRMILPFRMWVSEEKFQELRAYSVINGDIIISRAGTVGKMCVAKMDGIPAIISTNLIRLRLNSLLHPLYIVSLMTYFGTRVARLKTGADGTFTHMNTGILDTLEFPCPPIELQRKYADIIEMVEGIKSRYQQTLIELEHFYGVLSQKAFKGKLHLLRIQVA